MYKKPAFLFSCILLACIAMSFNNGKNKRTSVNGSKGASLITSPTVNINGNLYILYLTQGEMQSLLGRTAGGAKDDKVIFQFFFDQNGILDLNAWPKKSGAFPYKTDLLLHETTVTCTSIPGDNVHLGNIRLGPAEFKALKAVITQYQYFIFVPTVNPVDATDKYYYIVYDIYGDNSLPTACPYPIPSTITTKTPIATTRNPSPPYHG